MLKHICFLTGIYFMLGAVGVHLISTYYWNCKWCTFSLTDMHVVEVEVWGAGAMATGKAFHCRTVRRNPAQVGNVTGAATYASFLSSVLGKSGHPLVCLITAPVAGRCDGLLDRSFMGWTHWAISRSSSGVTKAVVCAILSVGWCI